MVEYVKGDRVDVVVGGGMVKRVGVWKGDGRVWGWCRGGLMRRGWMGEVMVG